MTVMPRTKAHCQRNEAAGTQVLRLGRLCISFARHSGMRISAFDRLERRFYRQVWQRSALHILSQLGLSHRARRQEHRRTWANNIPYSCRRIWISIWLRIQCHLHCWQQRAGRSCKNNLRILLCLPSRLLAHENCNTAGKCWDSTTHIESDSLFFCQLQSNEWAHDFAQFANGLESATSAKYPHKPLTSFFWWAWNGVSLSSFA